MQSITTFFFPHNALKDQFVRLGETPDQNYGFSQFESLSTFKLGFLKQRKQLLPTADDKILHQATTKRVVLEFSLRQNH